MDTNELAKAVSEILDMSIADARSTIESLDTEQLINLESALDADDIDAVEEIFQEAHAEQEEEQDAEVPEMDDVTKIKSEIQRLGKQSLETGTSMDAVWKLIAQLKETDWRLMWPSIDQDILISLLSEATDEEADSVRGSDAPKIYQYAKELVKEHRIYQGEIVEVTLAHGPNGTVGIRTSRGLKMVSNSELGALNEQVLGMTQMPSIHRVRELAGLPPSASTAPVVVPSAQVQVPACDVDLSSLANKLTEIQQALEQGDRQGAGLAARHLAHLASRLARSLAEDQE